MIGIFFIATSIANMVSLMSHYWGDWETVLTAKSTPESIVWFIVGSILYIYALISKSMISDAYFYNSYFEGDLDGEIKYNDLTAITGKSKGSVRKQLHFFRKVYMKSYDFKAVNNAEQIALFSKKCTCECRQCGAVIEKSEYFTGTCPYCDSSDLFTKVLTDNRFYSIINQNPNNRTNPEFYISKHLKHIMLNMNVERSDEMKKTLYLILITILVLLTSCDSGLSIVSIEITKYPNNLIYIAGHDEGIDLSGGEIMLTVAQGNEYIYSMSDESELRREFTVNHSIDFAKKGVYIVEIKRADDLIAYIPVQVIDLNDYKHISN